MPTYICHNKDCVDFNKESYVMKTTIKYVDGCTVDSSTICPICNSNRDRVIVSGMTTTMHGGDNVCKK